MPLYLNFYELPGSFVLSLVVIESSCILGTPCEALTETGILGRRRSTEPVFSLLCVLFLSIFVLNYDVERLG